MTRAQAGYLGAVVRVAQLQAERKARIAVYSKNPKRCRACNAALSYDDVLVKKVFCNLKCRAVLFMPKVRVSLKPKKKCLVCDNLTTNAKFCSSSCCGLFVRGGTKAKVLAGVSVSPDNARRVLIHLRGRRCERCNNTEWLGEPIPLDRHHVDGNSSNNLMSNVKLLCKNCHALTPTFGSKNRGKGRHLRRVRYHAGKSN